MSIAVPITLPPIESSPVAPRGIEVVPLSPTIGSEVLGIDLREPLTPDLHGSYINAHTYMMASGCADSR